MLYKEFKVNFNFEKYLRNINELLILNLLHKNVFNHSSNTAWVSLNNST